MVMVATIVHFELTKAFHAPQSSSSPRVAEKHCAWRLRVLVPPTGGLPWDP